MGCWNYQDLKQHIGHKIVCVGYGESEDPMNVAVECEDCCEVIMNYDRDKDCGGYTE